MRVGPGTPNVREPSGRGGTRHVRRSRRFPDDLIEKGADTRSCPGGCISPEAVGEAGQSGAPRSELVTESGAYVRQGRVVVEDSWCHVVGGGDLEAAPQVLDVASLGSATAAWLGPREDSAPDMGRPDEVHGEAGERYERDFAELGS